MPIVRGRTDKLKVRQVLVFEIAGHVHACTRDKACESTTDDIVMHGTGSTFDANAICRIHRPIDNRVEHELNVLGIEHLDRAFGRRTGDTRWTFGTA